jgi:hypothetical protein
MNQTIEGGEGNVQIIGDVGRDLIVHQAPKLSPDNPNLIDCPSCWQPVSRYAHPCPNCGLNVQTYFESITQRQREKSLAKRSLAAVVLGLLLMILSYVMPTKLQLLTFLGGFMMLLLAYVLGRATGKI